MTDRELQERSQIFNRVYPWIPQKSCNFEGWKQHLSTVSTQELQKFLDYFSEQEMRVLGMMDILATIKERVSAEAAA